jgi:hypothetical protein
MEEVLCAMALKSATKAGWSTTLYLASAFAVSGR